MSRGILAAASDFEIHDSQFIDYSRNYTHTVNISPTVEKTIKDIGMGGLQNLLSHSIPDALHDSSARDPPPRCHPGTRYDYIDRITSWCLNKDGRQHHMIWMYGPAGVGKSAVSQSCAEIIAESGKLGAAFFFSMFNKRDNPNLFFPTISYQLAMKNKSYRRIIETMVSDDPTLVTKSIKQQFQDLIVTPPKELKARGEDVDERVIIIDGLDECASKRAQCEIIDIVAASIREEATPFLWIFISRPEAHIQSKFASSQIFPLSLHIELTVSREIDHEITKFLTEELREVQIEHGLPDSWPSDRQIGKLVNLSAGLFIYASTVIRFIKNDNSSGPDDQLQIILSTPQQPMTEEDGTHPLSELNFFYTLIMQRVPQKILPTVQKILLATTFSAGKACAVNASVLGLSETQFRNACRFLHSVLEIRGHNDFQFIEFYHRSFMEFLLDAKRSKNFYLRADCAAALGKELLDKLSEIHSRSNSRSTIDIPVAWPRLDQYRTYGYMVNAFFDLCQSAPLNRETFITMATFSYAKIPALGNGTHYLPDLMVDMLSRNIPAGLRGKIIRRYPRFLFHAALLEKPNDAERNRPHVLGRGKGKALLWRSKRGGSYICPYPHLNAALVAKFVKAKVMGPPKDWANKPG